MVEFYIGTAHVDMARSQITTELGTSSLEPKVMQVLLILAQNQGDVVNHDIILQTVWPDTITSANAIQRCVGQLRKVLNDTAQSQQVIATHPKIGYSLIPEVKWHNPNKKEYKSESKVPLTTPNQGSVLANNKFLIISGLLICMILALTVIYNMHTNAPFIVKSLTPLTATDHVEQKPSYSPNGKYVVFQRFIGDCKSQLWAREISTSKEYLLTKEKGNYGVPRWSPDGERIVFTSKAQCSLAPDSPLAVTPSTHQRKSQSCNEIRGISFYLAKASPQPSTLYHRCGSKTHSQPVWLTTSKIAFITQQAHNSYIKLLDINTNNVTQLHKVDNKTISALDYSQPLKKLAWIESRKYMPFELAVYDTNTQNLNKAELDEHSSISYIGHIRWLFDLPTLLTSKNNQLIKIDLLGEITFHPQPTTDKILYPALHPGKHQIVASMGNFDRDIGLTRWYADRPQTLSKKTTFSRSNVDDFNAKQQPNGKLVAFTSSRSGSEQVWLYDQNSHKTAQLSNFPSSIAPIDMLWNKSASALFILIHKQLYLLSLDGKLSLIKTPLPLLGIYQDRGDNQLLVKQLKGTKPSFALLNLDSQQFQSLYFGDADKAVLSYNDELFILKDKSIYKVTNAERHRITTLEEFEAEGLFTYQGQLYITSSTNALWRYNSRSEQTTILTQLDDNIDNISDINIPNKIVYYSQLVKVKKELMLLDLE